MNLFKLLRIKLFPRVDHDQHYVTEEFRSVEQIRAGDFIDELFRRKLDDKMKRG